MWKLFKFFGLLIKICLWLIALSLVAVSIFLFSIRRGIPDAWVQRLSEHLSTPTHVCRIDRITYSPIRGLTVHTFKLLPKGVLDKPLISADELNVQFEILSFDPPGRRLTCITIKKFDFPLLPPRKTKTGPQAGSTQPIAGPVPATPKRLELPLPEIGPFKLILEQANILGICTKRTTATLSADAHKITVDDLTVVWPDMPALLPIVGNAELDLDAQRVTGAVKGQAYPGHITPLLLNLRAKGTVKQMSFFENIEKPINAAYTIDLALDTLDFAMTIGIDLGPCTYRGVPFEYAKGNIRVTDTNSLTIADIGPIDARAKSGPLTGRLVYRDDDDSLFVDAQSGLSMPDFLNVINVLNKGELKVLHCETPPRVIAKGIVATDSTKTNTINDLAGKISFDQGTILKIPLTNLSCDMRLYGHSLVVSNILGNPPKGGQLSGNIDFAFPKYCASNTIFVATVKANDADLGDVAKIFSPSNTYIGQISGTVSLQGSTYGKTLPGLDGSGKMEIKNSLLARMPLFAGLTDWLASNIPGMSMLVNQSSGSLDFTLEDGVLKSENLLIEGDVFSIGGKGTYNLDADAIDMAIRVNVFKEKTFAGQLTRVVTFPFSRLLMDFHLGGSFKKTDWSYVSLVEKITDSLKSSPEKSEPPLRGPVTE